MPREIGPDTIPDELLLKDADRPYGAGFAVVAAKDGKIGGVIIEKGDPVEQSLAALLLLGVDEDTVQSFQAGSQ